MGVTAIKPSDIALAAGPYLWGLKNGALVRKYASGRRGGEELKEAHTCASTAALIDRDLTYRLAAIDGLRPQWEDRDSDGIADLLTVLLEEQSTNLVLRSEDFGTSWNVNGTPTRTPAALAIGEVVLDLIGDDDAAGLERYNQVLSFTGDAVKAVSFHWKAGTSVKSIVQIRDDTAVADRLNVQIVPNADGSPALTLSTGTLQKTRRLASGVYRIECQTSAVTVANTNRLYVMPTDTNVASVGNAYFGGIMAEDAPQCSSYKKTLGATVARNRNVLSFPLYVAPNKNLCIYHRHIELEAPNFAAATRLWHIGAAANTNPRLFLNKVSGADFYQGQHFTAAGSSGNAVDVNPLFNDLIETRVIYNAATGAVQTGAAKSVGTETLSAAGSALTPAATWSDVVLHINSVGTSASTIGKQGWIATIVVTWSGTAPSMDDFRGLLA